jgi:hypothetical protein
MHDLAKGEKDKKQICKENMQNQHEGMTGQGDILQ